MRTADVKVVGLPFALAGFITITIYLMPWAASRFSKTVVCSAPPVIQQRQDQRTYPRSRNRIEFATDTSASSLGRRGLYLADVDRLGSERSTAR